jgi:hypothetical protein
VSLSLDLILLLSGISIILDAALVGHGVMHGKLLLKFSNLSFKLFEQ